ncbi:unnamed protein product [Sordaria macrospora k-hell]|uniref:WGS project CABT00000000 data, contig 2.45 n=1 Tax=Sordaria macrospora (strain ATCC MYA-333 / DSM 997 / K(L3346) / K-hell) TaxID=771870 RepID=F7W8M5_SORMK|nr:uncharacterized protein SMAC_07379 [Sordaria macrospora k-hell]CCC05056.1 unnamed protein product [Sordaria macrospora k-hell]
MIHDFGVTENFPITPLLCDVERMKQGGDHWQWVYSTLMYTGVLPRRGGQGSDVKWFEAPHGFAGHWPKPRTTNFAHFVLDYQTEELQLAEPTYFVDNDMEFPRIDDRVAMRQHNHTFLCIFECKPGVTDSESVMPRAGGGAPMSNGIAHLNHENAAIQRYLPRPGKLTGECIFIPRGKGAAEGAGYVMVLLANYEEICSELAVLDVKDLTKEVALVKLRCDGQRPICGQCKEFDVCCAYNEPPTHHRPRLSTTDIPPSGILSRLSALEGRINDANASLTTGAKRSSEDANQYDGDDDDAQDDDRESNSISNGLLAPPTLTGPPTFSSWRYQS